MCVCLCTSYQPNSLCANPFNTSDKNCCMHVLLKIVNIYEAKILIYYFISSGLWNNNAQYKNINQGHQISLFTLLHTHTHTHLHCSISVIWLFTFLVFFHSPIYFQNLLCLPVSITKWRSLYLEEVCFIFHQFSCILELILSKVMMSDVWTWKENGAQSYLGSCIGVSIDCNSNAFVTF